MDLNDNYAIKLKMDNKNNVKNNSNKSERNIDTLTFLKSNYKYKRRFQLFNELPPVTEMAQPTHEHEPTNQNLKNSKNNNSKILTTTNSRSNNYKYKENTCDKKKSDKFTFSVILKLFIAIIGNFMQHNWSKQLLYVHGNFSSRMQLEEKEAITGGISAINDDWRCLPPQLQHRHRHRHRHRLNNHNASNNNIIRIDSDEISYQRKYDKVSTTRCQDASPPTRHHQSHHHHHQRHQQQQQQQQQHHRYQHRMQRMHDYCSITLRRSLMDLSTTSTSSTTLMPTLSVADCGCGSTNLWLLILMTLFIALSLSVRSVEAGACWLSSNEHGKCNKIYSLNITRSECCSNQDFSFTDRELTSVEYFFATSIGSGIDCMPCIQSCKQMTCGLNKKCIKRKGRPKCVCAPDCGAAKRRREREKLYAARHEHHNEALRQMTTDVSAVTAGAGMAVTLAKSPRDIRSLSSEITNVNLGLDSAGRLLQQQLENQRKKQNPHKLQFNNVDMDMNVDASTPKPKRKILVIANVDRYSASAGVDRTNTRKFQVINNVRNHRVHKKNKLNLDKRRNHEYDHTDDDDDNDDHDDSLMRTTDAVAATMMETRRGSFMSRHKSNTNNSFMQHKNNEQQQQQSVSYNHYYNKNSNNKNGNRVRHFHQNVRYFKNAPNHDEVESKYNEQQQQQKEQQIHRKRKHQHNRNKQKKLKDHQNANSTRFTATTGTSLSSTFEFNSSPSFAADAAVYNTSQSVRISSSTSSAIATKASNATTKKLKLQTLTTPANSPTSTSTTTDRRLLNRGSNSATSSTATATKTAGKATATATTMSSGTASMSAPAHIGGVSVNRAGGSNLVNSDDFTFLDGIYDKYNLHGFPNQQHEFTPFESIHSSHPVCGTDGRTYNTECQLKKRACRTDNSNLQVAYRGHCKTTCNGVKCLNGLTCVEDQYTIPHCIACKIDCPQDDRLELQNVIDPTRAVCGVDGKTYKSVCDINRMICKIGRSIGVAYPGPCLADRPTCNDITCGPKYTCLVDLLTHEPRCIYCRYKCARKRRPASLRYEEGKICGVNNRTYHSWCEMQKDSCSTGFYIDVKSPGACQ